MTKIIGKWYSHEVTKTTSSLTPQAQYSAWAAEIQVSDTGTDAALDADDTAFTIPLNRPGLPTGNTTAVFSSEGGFGLYRDSVSPGASSIPYNSLDGVSRMYGFTNRADLFITFHPQVDCRSESVKFRTASNVAILSGRIRAYPGSTPTMEFAIRVDDSGLQIIVGQTDTDLAVNYFLDDVNSSYLTDAVSTGVLAKYTISSIYERAVYRIDLKELSSVSTNAYTGTVRILPTPLPLKARGNYLIGVAGKGIGRIRNTVKEKNEPVNTIAFRRVRLIRERDFMPIREQWSDPVTGNYDFQYVDELETYVVVSLDHTHHFRIVGADNLTLANGGVELMP